MKHRISSADFRKLPNRGGRIRTDDFLHPKQALRSGLNLELSAIRPAAISLACWCCVGAAILIATGCDAPASGRIEGGRTDLTRDVTTDAGQTRNYRKRVVVIGETPAPVKK